MADLKRKKKRILIGGVVVLILVTLVLLLLFFKPFKIRRTLIYAQNAIQSKDYTVAKEYLEEVFKIDDGNIEALMLQTQLAIEQEKPLNAKASLERLAKLENKNDSYKQLLYDYSILIDDYAVASSLMLSNPIEASEKEYVELAKGLHEDNYKDQAKLCLEKGLEEFPDSIGLRSFAVSFYLDEKKYDTAISIYEKLGVLLAPEVNNKLALAYELKKEDEKALILWKESFLQDNTQELVAQKLHDYYTKNADIESLRELELTLQKLNIKMPESNSNVIGNSSSHLHYRGLMASEGDFLYLANGMTKSIIRLDKSNLEKQEVVLNQTAKYLNLQNSILYFVDPSDSNSLYSFALGNKESTKLLDESVSQIQVYAKFLYYISNDNEDTLWRLNLETKEKEQLTSDPVYQFTISDDFVYYLDLEKQNLWNYSFETNEKKLILEGSYSDLTVDEALNLYCIDKQNDYILRYDTKLGTKETLLSEPSRFLNYSQGSLFFVSWTPQKYDIKKQTKSNLSSNISEELYIFDDMVFSFENKNPDGRSYKIYYFQSDGSKWSVFLD